MQIDIKSLRKTINGTDTDTSKPEAEIIRLVHELYGLSEEEIEVVEGRV